MTTSDDEILRALEAADGVKAIAARAIGMADSTFKDRLKKITGAVPMAAKSACVQLEFDDDGNATVRRAWPRFEKSNAAALEALRTYTSGIAPLKPSKAAKSREGGVDLLDHLTITDAHIGMLAWHEETGGDDWDVEIAKRVLIDNCCHLMEDSLRMHGSDTILIDVRGDFLHYDSLLALTPTSKHVLDADGRAPKMIRAGIDVLLSVIAFAARRYANVIVWMLEGNHDESFSLINREWMSRYFEKFETVLIETSPSPYYAMPWGVSLIGSTHGHLARGVNLAEVFSQRFRHYMSQTKKTYIYTGHLHSSRVDETNTAVITRHPTAAAADAYASRHGWESLRQGHMCTYHKDRFRIGVIERAVV